MCIFCAAIPFTLAVGARLNVQQKENQKNAASQGKALPVGALTIIAVSGLAVSSVIYHTHAGNGLTF